MPVVHHPSVLGENEPKKSVSDVQVYEKLVLLRAIPVRSAQEQETVQNCFRRDRRKERSIDNVGHGLPLMDRRYSFHNNDCSK